jgi:hypothetical protein
MKADKTRRDQLTWVRAYSKDESDYTEHVGGLSWHEAGPPAWLHRCQPQTRGRLEGTYVELCRCGAIRNRPHGMWRERNHVLRARRRFPDTRQDGDSGGPVEPTRLRWCSAGKLLERQVYVVLDPGDMSATRTFWWQPADLAVGRHDATAVITGGSLASPLQPSSPYLDCGWLTCRHDEPGEWYMVTDQVWEEAGMTGSGRWLSEHPEVPIGPAGGLAIICASAASKTAWAVG